MPVLVLVSQKGVIWQFGAIWKVVQPTGNSHWDTGSFCGKLSLPRVLSVCFFEDIARIQQVIGGIARTVTVPCSVAHECDFYHG